MNLTEGDKRRMAVGAAIVAPLGAMVAHDKITEIKEIKHQKRLNKAVRAGQQANRIADLTTRHVVNAEKNFNRRMKELTRQIHTGETQKPARGANQNNPPKNVRFMGNNAGGFKMGDPRTSVDSYERFAKNQVAKADRGFRAVHQLGKILNEPNVKNYEQARDAARQNKDVPKPKAANTNYTKKALNAIKTMGRVIKGSSIIGAISYAASSTPVGDATLDGKKYTNYKYTPNK
tara:strand:- start:2709 stop:3407 length:699 start_codon:yes stop_codon:yes gene_type:complete